MIPIVGRMQRSGKMMDRRPIQNATIVLLFTDKLFNSRQCVYAFTVGFTFVMALINGLETANVKFEALENLLTNYVPMHTLGLGWVWFAAAGYIIGLVWMKLVPEKQ